MGHGAYLCCRGLIELPVLRCLQMCEYEWHPRSCPSASDMPELSLSLLAHPTEKESLYCAIGGCDGGWGTVLRGVPQPRICMCLSRKWLLSQLRGRIGGINVLALVRPML